MLQHFLALYLMLFAFSVLTAQTIISDALSFTGTAPDEHGLYTQRGDFFVGKAVFIRNDTIGFRIRGLEEVSLFLFAEVRFLGTADEALQSTTEVTIGEPGLTEKRRRRTEDLPMPLNQLLYSGTAIPYEGRGSYRNTMILINQADYQIGEHFVIGAGAFIPALFMVKAKAQVTASELLHLGLAAHHYFPLYDDATYTHPYVIVTLGERERYLNFTGGYWIQRYRFDDNRDVYPMVTLAGSFAFAPSWRFFAEAAAVFRTGSNLVLPTFNFSNRSGRGMFEFGIMAIPDTEIPVLPILSYHRLF